MSRVSGVGFQTDMRARASLVGVALTLTGCTGVVFDGTPSPSVPATDIDVPGVDCATAPGVSPLRRLPQRVYRQAVIDVLTTSGLSSMIPSIEPALDAVPPDSTLSFLSHDNRLSTEHLSAWFAVATGVGDAIEQSAPARTALVGACGTAARLTPECRARLFDGFGRRVLRRPLTDTERAELTDLDDGTRPAAEALRAMVVVLLLSPSFLNQVELNGAQRSAGAPLELTSWELASRLAFTYWRSIPDDALLDAAANGSLLTEAGFRAQLERVFADPRTRRGLWAFWQEWLKLEAFPGFSVNRPGFQSLTRGLSFTNDTYAEMVEEVRLLTERHTFEAPASMDELLTTNVSLTRSNTLAAIYGAVVWNGQGEPPRLTNRAGLLQRAAIVVSNQEHTNPFHRGAIMRRALLCDVLPQPDPVALPPGSLDPPPFSAAATTRQRYEAKVANNPLCTGCHENFSDLGYVQEAFDAIGRVRTKERVFDEQTGAMVAELEFDLQTVPRVRLDDDRPVRDVAELNERIVESGRVATCLVRNFTAMSLRRNGVTGADQCAEARVARRLREGGTLAEAFKAIALEPSFRQRAVEAP